MKKILYLTLIAVMGLLVGACRQIIPSSSKNFQILYNSYYYPIMKNAMSQRGIPKEEQERFCSEVKVKLEQAITSYLTEDEINEVNLIFHSKKFCEVVKRGMENQSLSAEDQTFLTDIVNLSSGFRKFISKDLQTKITEAMVEVIESKRN